MDQRRHAARNALHIHRGPPVQPGRGHGSLGMDRGKAPRPPVVPRAWKGSWFDGPSSKFTEDANKPSADDCETLGGAGDGRVEPAGAGVAEGEALIEKHHVIPLR